MKKILILSVFIFSCVCVLAENASSIDSPSLVKGVIFSGILSFIMVSFAQWLTQRDNFAIWKPILIGLILLIAPWFVVIKIFNLPPTISNAVYLLIPVFWGMIFILSLSFCVFEKNYYRTRNWIISLNLFFSILFCLIFRPVALICISSMAGLLFGLLTIYFWRWYIPRRDLYLVKNFYKKNGKIYRKVRPLTDEENSSFW